MAVTSLENMHVQFSAVFTASLGVVFGVGYRLLCVGESSDCASSLVLVGFLVVKDAASCLLQLSTIVMLHLVVGVAGPFYFQFGQTYFI